MKLGKQCMNQMRNTTKKQELSKKGRKKESKGKREGGREGKEGNPRAGGYNDCIADLKRELQYKYQPSRRVSDLKDRSSEIILLEQ